MIINSLLDSDLYKFSMQQAILHQFPGAMVEYKFKCRTPGINLVQHIEEIKHEIGEWCTLRFADDELLWLSGIRYLKVDYIEYLRNYKPNPMYVHVIPMVDDSIEIIIRGPWVTTVLYEVPILAIVNEVYFKHMNKTPKEVADGCLERLSNKIITIKEMVLNDFKFADFGTRRRFSLEVQYHVLKILKSELPNNLVGTSNVLFAKKLGLTPIGTHAHEWFMACQSMVRLCDSQKFALQKWADEYRGDLGIALSDCLGMEAFFRDFDPYFSKLFDGCRHDSGDPYVWCDKLIDHYKKYGIDPKTKRAVFSDGLTIPKAIELYRKYHEEIQCVFGIGTNLTNDVGLEPIQIVIKMTSCNGAPVAKLSDSPGKQMCEDQQYLDYLKSVFNIKE